VRFLSADFAESFSLFYLSFDAMFKSLGVNFTNILGGDTQNFLHKFVRFFFVTLGLEILRLFRFKALFEADIIKG